MEVFWEFWRCSGNSGGVLGIPERFWEFWRGSGGFVPGWGPTAAWTTSSSPSAPTRSGIARNPGNSGNSGGVLGILEVFWEFWRCSGNSGEVLGIPERFRGFCSRLGPHGSLDNVVFAVCANKVRDRPESWESWEFWEFWRGSGNSREVPGVLFQAGAPRQPRQRRLRRLRQQGLGFLGIPGILGILGILERFPRFLPWQIQRVGNCGNSGEVLGILEVFWEFRRGSGNSGEVLGIPERFRGFCSRLAPHGSLDNVVFAVCANKVDAGKLRVVDESEGRLWAESRGFLYWETSAQSGEGIQEMFQNFYSAIVELCENGGKRPAGGSGASFTREQADAIRRIRSSKDSWDTLGLKPGASREEVTRAYRRLAVLLHPDKCLAPGSEDAFKAVGSARAALLKNIK
ncbi:dnaJ homolog subfamily C member 27 isoform X2 [Motacilla alba alba]|uniref:dnaJ homolog subfamily C member 27 isoform X2 n=1 Tax=Motacilla alba alba TaxID=1094192 RepID=UPI0018D54769|nr:dnaJ homolog subfamily C member 27 isoform X2 [Motacilla alba alba]